VYNTLPVWQFVVALSPKIRANALKPQYNLLTGSVDSNAALSPRRPSQKLVRYWMN